MRLVADLRPLQQLVQQLQIKTETMRSVMSGYLIRLAARMEKAAETAIAMETPVRSGALKASTQVSSQIGGLAIITDVRQPATNGGYAYGWMVRNGPPAKDPQKAAAERAKYGGYLSKARPNPYQTTAQPYLETSLSIIYADWTVEMIQALMTA